ncbi:hypothetical protein QCB45_08710 [Thiomicrorhabdus sp. ZW0627]|uniref:hypothetical protein n=1 Tax=Thiomicrorhabdus sp. ZW0627 TaxID=3039774 RepID=UPI002436F997|nr:hypothetical protein [Thiomicrorhabdus sp. ZW0627]MDG6774409.1 hypothetical protein [Thiomicrorhabdus sp. ZW0627]
MLVQKLEIGQTYLIELIVSCLLLMAPDALAADYAVDRVESGALYRDGYAGSGMNGYSHLNRAEPGLQERTMLLSEGRTWNMSVGLDKDGVDQSQWNLMVYFTSAFK